MISERERQFMQENGITGMRAIFLDIDGVLNRCGPTEDTRTTERWRGAIGIEPAKVALFNRILAAGGGTIHWVLSSAWRHDPDWQKTMEANGLDMLMCRGRTPFSQDRIRGEEIAAWIRDNGKHAIGGVYRYAILDDDSDMLPEQQDSFFHCDYRTGLTEEIAERVVDHLMHP